MCLCSLSDRGEASPFATILKTLPCLEHIAVLDYYLDLRPSLKMGLGLPCVSRGWTRGWWTPSAVSAADVSVQVLGSSQEESLLMTLLACIIQLILTIPGFLVIWKNKAVWAQYSLQIPCHVSLCECLGSHAHKTLSRHLADPLMTTDLLQHGVQQSNFKSTTFICLLIVFVDWL